MPEHATATVLSPEAAARLVEFARACRTAARAVSLYPAAHPAIAASVARLAHITASFTSSGRFRVQVTSDRLLVEGAGLPKTDQGVAELADLLHRHLVGALTVNPGADRDSWHALLLLLARSPETVRRDGGISHLWGTAGGPSIEIEEIDYAEVLREKIGLAAAAEQIIAAALSGARLDLDESGMRLLLEIVESPVKLQELIAQLEHIGQAQGAETEAAAFLAIVHGLARWLSRHDPPRLDEVFTQMGEAAGRLSAGAMLKLLEHRTHPDAVVGPVNVAGLVIARMTDDAISHFVAGSVIRERGATERLAHAFQALVPDADRQRRLLAAAGQEVSASDPGIDGGMADLWQRVESMLTSYSDATYVSEPYGRELSDARTRALDVEQASDDPPERVAAWLSTVGDAPLRELDHQLLHDLLRIEPDPLRWRDVAGIAAAHAEDLVRVGYFDQAWSLADLVVSEARRDPARAPHAAVLLERFGGGGMMRHVAVHLRGSDEESYRQFARLCTEMGPSLIPAIARLLAAEQDERARLRLRGVLLGFGAVGREPIRALMTADDPEVRRTAASLLREFAGADSLRELVPLLTDSAPLVRREAVHALMMHGSQEASRLLLEALTSASGPARSALRKELTSTRDERAAPLFCHVVGHADPRPEPQLYLFAIEALGAIGGPDAVGSLKQALYRGDWRAPIRTRRARRTAARALQRIGTPDATHVLRQAAATGTMGVRAAARSQLASLP